MNCRTCGYEFDPTQGLECPRCGEQLDCSSLDCSECDACSGVFGGLTKRFKRASADGAEE
jgi:hypothetical protein